MTAELVSLRERFERDGFAVTAQPWIPADLVERTIQRMNALAGGIHDRPGQPYRRWNVGHPTRIQKIDNAHLADQTLFELITHPAIGRLAAAISGARWVQAWSTQLLYKPGHSGQDGCVGWHRDMQYWHCWRGSLFTITVALTAQSAANGAVSFVRGSHRWQQSDRHGDAYRQDMSAHQSDVAGGTDTGPWDEQPLQAPPGALCIHHARTLHGSRPNTEALPRRSLAINLRTENSWPVIGTHDFGMWDCMGQAQDFPVVHRQRVA